MGGAGDDRAGRDRRAVPRRAGRPGVRGDVRGAGGGVRPADATLGQGGSIPLCTVFAETYPAAEIILMGVEEPQALIHAPNESVDPNEIAAMALAEALFLQRYASDRG